MIQSREDLKYYLSEDLIRFGNKKPDLKDKILHNEVWYIYHYIKHLRYVEYYKNTKRSKILFLYHWLKYKRLGFKLRFTIYPNTVGPGFRIYHAGGFIHIGPKVKIGKNCTLLPGVVFGNKSEIEDEGLTILGDNCYLGIDAKIIGSVTIGNNVVIGANSVVTKDIPDNAVVAGIPAKIIKINK